MSLPSTIKAIRTIPNEGAEVYDAPFGTLEENFNLDSDSILVKVHAVALNPTDSVYTYALPTLVAVGCDAAGFVVAVGKDVTHVAPGDRVFGMVCGVAGATNGAFAEYVRFKKSVTTKIPSTMTFVEAAAFPLPLYTAFQTLYLRFGLFRPSNPSKQGTTILIWGGGTAVGHHAVQLASLSGYKVITTASPVNHANLRSLGASVVFDYRDENIVKLIKGAAGEEGVAFALDTACLHGSTSKCIDSIGPSGGKFHGLLPTSGEDVKRRADVQAEFSVVFTLIGDPAALAPDYIVPVPAGDVAACLGWVSHELPALLRGWDSSKGGSPKLKAQRLRVGAGGLESVIDGMREMRKGTYSAEKFVFSLV